MAKKFVLSGYFGFKNFGDEAILSVIVNKLKGERAVITVISSNPDYTKSKFSNIETVYTFAIPKIIKEIVTADYLISGGGSLLQDVTSLKSLIYYLGIISIALFFHKKVIIFAQGIGPINNKFGKLFTKILLKHCKYVSVRDVKSRNLLKSWGIDSELVFDPVYSVPVTKKECKNKTLAIQLREFKTMNNEFLMNLAKEINKNFSEYNIEIFSFQDSIDFEICNKFKSYLTNCQNVTVYSGLNEQEIIEKLSKVEYLVSMRFHAIIIALLSGVKTLCVNYDVKVENLAKEFDLPVINLCDKDFKTEFVNLLSQNTSLISEKVKDKKFDWSGFNKAIM